MPDATESMLMLASRSAPDSCARIPGRLRSARPATVIHAILVSEYLRRNYGGSLYAKARNHVLELRAAYDDVLVAPPARGAAPEGLDDDGDPVMNLPWTHAGVPVVSMPVGSTDAGLPVGIACIGRFGRDESLLEHSGAIRDALSAPPR